MFGNDFDNSQSYRKNIKTKKNDIQAKNIFNEEEYNGDKVYKSSGRDTSATIQIVEYISEQNEENKSKRNYNLWDFSKKNKSKLGIARLSEFPIEFELEEYVSAFFSNCRILYRKKYSRKRERRNFRIRHYCRKL